MIKVIVRNNVVENIGVPSPNDGPPPDGTTVHDFDGPCSVGWLWNDGSPLIRIPRRRRRLSPINPTRTIISVRSRPPCWSWHSGTERRLHKQRQRSGRPTTACPDQ